MESSYRYWLYDYEHPNIESILYHFDMLLRKYPRLKLNVIVVYSKRPLDQLIEEWVPEGFERKISGNRQTGIFTIKLRRQQLEGEIEEDALIIQFGSEFIYFVINDYVSGRNNEVLLPFLNAYYPDISRPYYSSSELYLLLKRLHSNTRDGKIVVHRTSELHGIGTRRRRLNVLYTYEVYDDVFSRLYDQRIWINKVQFSLMGEEDALLLRGYLSKDSRFRCSKSFRTFYDSIILAAASMAEKKIRAFSNRNRTIERPIPQVIDLSFDYEVFDKEQISQFSDVLSTFPNSSTSVFHRNPYYHASLVDRLDGSSYDVWVVNTRQIHIVPQLRANTASLSRFVNHIFENFREGETEGYFGPKSIKID